MIDQDMLLRGGLMLSVLMLAGIFGASLGETMSEDADEGMEKIAREIGSIVSTLHQQGPGSSVILSFGRPGVHDGAGIVLPSKINGQYFEIQVGPGLLTIRSNGLVRSITFGPWFIPSLPPEGPALMPPNVCRNISRIIDGYTIRTPVIMELVLPHFCAGGEVFIYPRELKDIRPSSGVDDLQGLIHESGELYPGWTSDAVIDRDEILAYEHPVLLMVMDSPTLGSGSCPLPVLLPDDLKIDPVAFSSSTGPIRFYKEVVMGSDGIMVFRSGSEMYDL